MRFLAFPAILSLLLTMVSCHGYKYQPDNIIEEAAEMATDIGIHALTGQSVDIDFTPGTPEKGFSPKSLSPVIKVEPAPAPVPVPVPAPAVTK